MSPKDNNDTQLMHSKSDNIELFQSFLTKYPKG